MTAPTTPRIADELREHAVPIETLTPYPGNAKRHDIDVIRQSLREHGQYRPAVVQRSTGYVLIGNGMLEAARLEGMTHLARVVKEYDDDEARRLVLVDNRSTELGGYDDAALAELLGGLTEFDGTGYDDGDLAALRALLDSAVPDFPGSDQDAADAQERAAWPRVNVQVPRPLYARWRAVPGADDTARLTALLDAWDAAPR